MTLILPVKIGVKHLFSKFFYYYIIIKEYYRFRAGEMAAPDALSVRVTSEEFSNNW